MSARILALFVTGIAASCIAFADASSLTQALQDPRRPPAQVAQDALRKPAELTEFAGIHAGDRVADFMPGNAYFTRIFSEVVGPRGRVYAFVPTEQLEHCDPSETAGILALERDPSYGNVAVVRDRLDRFHLPEKLDVLWIALNYHDLHDDFLGPPDIVALNHAFFEALKPGGVLVLIDHIAQAGSGLRDTNTLHRIDPEQMRHEIEAAGFRLEASSDALRNRGDAHTQPVFDPAVRGRTDQAVMRFRKPPF